MNVLKFGRKCADCGQIKPRTYNVHSQQLCEPCLRKSFDQVVENLVADHGELEAQAMIDKAVLEITPTGQPI